MRLSSPPMYSASAESKFGAFASESEISDSQEKLAR